MAKPVSVLYFASIAPCVVLIYGFLGALIQAMSGYYNYGFIDIIGDLGAISFSCIPMSVFLYLAARLEWGKKNVDGIVLIIFIMAFSLLLSVAVTAHSMKLNWWLGLAQVSVCVVGIIYCVLKKSLPIRRKESG